MNAIVHVAPAAAKPEVDNAQRHGSASHPVRTALVCPFLCALLLLAPPVGAATTRYTYDWTATNIRDSNGSPPPVNPTTLSGHFAVLLDTTEPGFLPVDAALSDTSGFVTDSGATFGLGDSAYTVAAQSANKRRLDVGGLINGAQTTVGLSDDYRLEFIVAWSGGGLPSPTGDFVQTPFLYTNAVSAATPSGGAYLGDLQISLQAVSPVPIPAAAWLFASALGVIGYRTVRRTPLRFGATATRGLPEPHRPLYRHAPDTNSGTKY